MSVNVTTGRRERALVAPNDALGAVDGERAEVWRVADGRAFRREVRLGLRGLAMTEIIEGLAPGDRILADAAAPVAEGDRVRIVREALPTEGADAATRKELPATFD